MSKLYVKIHVADQINFIQIQTRFQMWKKFNLCRIWSVVRFLTLAPRWILAAMVWSLAML